MNWTQLTAVLTLAATTVALPGFVESAAAQQQQQQQQQQETQPVVFAGDGLSLEVQGYDQEQGVLGGYLNFNGQQYPFIAKIDTQRGYLDGKFAVAQNEEYPFTAQLTPDGQSMALTTAGKTYNLAIGAAAAPTPTPTPTPTDPNPLDAGNNQPDAGGDNPPPNFTPDFATGQQAYEHGDYQAAYDNLLPLAEGGNAEAAHMLGLMFHYGHGTAVDGKKAAEFYKIAADQDHPLALCNLGILYRDGIGVEKNAELAEKYLGRAAHMGVSEAQLAYGAMFWTGDLVKQNDPEAIAWWMIAADNGNKSAEGNLREIHRGDISADVFKKAQQRAVELRKAITKVPGAQKEQVANRTSNETRTAFKTSFGERIEKFEAMMNAK